MLDWNDIRFFLAAGRAGSLNAAARQLRTSQPTVGRRIVALEEALGVTLFGRHQDGLILTEVGLALWSRALAMEEAALALHRQVAAQDDSTAGTVRISVTEGLGTLWLTPRLDALASRYPNITLEVLLDNDAADLLRREADVAIRLARPITPNLIAKRVGQLAFQLFAAPIYTERFGIPSSLDELPRHRFVTLALRQSTVDETWQELLDVGSIIAFRSNSPLAQLFAVRAGLGIGLLPAYVAREFPDLRPVLPARIWRPREIWLVAHPEVKQSARVRIAFDEIARLFEADALGLAGPPEVEAES